MRRLIYFPYIFLVAFILFLLSLPIKTTQKIRCVAVASIAPFWEHFTYYKPLFAFKLFQHAEEKVPGENANLQLTLENRLLSSQVDSVYEWLSFEERIDEDMKRLKNVSDIKDDLYWNEFFRRRNDELKQILEVELQSIPAKVIFRDPASWSSSVWINVGQKTNESLGKSIVAKNSPVVIGDALIGVVEYVEKNQSRVRLITDSGLVPSVRAVRGKSQDRFLAKLAHSLLERVRSQENLFSTPEEKKVFISLLNRLIENYSQEKKDFYCAKGELHGSSLPLWRSKGLLLKGIGFNYEFEDEEGPARDLRTGEASKEGFVKFNLLEEGDLLVTTGLDGIFPAGLNAATVSKVYPLQDQDYAYEIEAKPCVCNLDDLSVVFVMPPLGFEVANP